MNAETSNAVADLFKAHTQYVQRLVELAQQAAAQGVERGQQVLAASIAESEEDFRTLQAAKDLSELSALQIDIARRRWEERMAAFQQLLQPGDLGTDSVAAGMVQAFKDWNEQVAGIVSGAAAAKGSRKK